MLILVSTCRTCTLSTDATFITECFIICSPHDGTTNGALRIRSREGDQRKESSEGIAGKKEISIG